jgi:RHS repeat-associated protein
VPNRNASTPAYRYGFQGQEKDDEIKGEGNSLNYTYRMHDPRIGRFFSRDPLEGKYPFYSPYAFSGNRVIDATELEGLEPEKVAKNNPFLIIVALGRASVFSGDQISEGKTQYKNMPNGYNNNDDGLGLLGSSFKIPGKVLIYGGSDSGLTANDIAETIANYRDTNPNGKVVLIGHSLGGKDVLDAANLVNGNNSMENKVINLIITMEAAYKDGNKGYPYSVNLSENTENVINFSSASPSYNGSGGNSAPDAKQADITLRSGTNHTNLDNTLTPFIGPILNKMIKGENPVDLVN